MALLKVENLGRKIGGRWALWDVGFEIAPGEVLGIFGRSGSGKTALARLLCGLEEPTNGRIVLGDDQPDPPVAVSAGFERPASAPELTVHENLNMFSSLWGVPRRRRHRDVPFIMELLKLSDFRGTRADRLPSGALARLEIARALSACAAVTVFDSLVDRLDPDVLEKFWDYMLSLRRDELRSFIILTARGKIAERCPRIAGLHRGRICYLGRPDDFRRIAGDDVVVLGEMPNALARKKIEERFSVIIREEDGFLSFRVGNGERVVNDLLSEFGTDLGCVYLKRPTIEDALDVVVDGGSAITADVGEERSC